MPFFDEWNFGAEEDPDYRRKVVRSKLLDPLGISLDQGDNRVIAGREDSPADTERRAKETAARLEAHDRMFGLDGGFAGSLERLSRPRYGALDESQDRDD